MVNTWMRVSNVRPPYGQRCVFYCIPCDYRGHIDYDGDGWTSYGTFERVLQYDPRTNEAHYEERFISDNHVEYQMREVLFWYPVPDDPNKKGLLDMNWNDKNGVKALRDIENLCHDRLKYLQYIDERYLNEDFIGSDIRDTINVIKEVLNKYDVITSEVPFEEDKYEDK